MAESGNMGKYLDRDIVNAGFYPQLVSDVVRDALDGQIPSSHLVHLETHFDQTEVHRHVTVLALAGDIVQITHVDDQSLDEDGNQVVAHVSTETVPVRNLTSVTLSYAYRQPQNYTPDSLAAEVTLMMSWTGSHRLDLQPAGCSDPQCEADHGYTGVAAREDVVLRISAEADGQQAVQDAKEFARALRRANTALSGTSHS
ncbi:cell wall biosynthesis glycosyltransferase [Kocuria koreensis]|uniref:Cell wall biosynthesis glycosyltransferase n=1 Tax=Rothia koreensis TaxID=592378 RepID=A0A7K1LHM5_9MICC|nr:DUF5998 family protein [Rothia koreensis]MUN54686.1 cell wall biosynthesis glycosyltransferase [Rothia koreensis]